MCSQRFSVLSLKAVGEGKIINTVIYHLGTAKTALPGTEPNTQNNKKVREKKLKKRMTSAEHC